MKNTPVEAFEAPEGITFAYVDPQTGALAEYNDLKAIKLCFKQGTVGTGLTEVKTIIDSETDSTEAQLNEKEL